MTENIRVNGTCSREEYQTSDEDSMIEEDQMIADMDGSNNYINYLIFWDVIFIIKHEVSFYKIFASRFGQRLM